MNILRTVFTLILAISFLTSCKVKNVNTAALDTEKNQMNFVFLYHKAVQNYLAGLYIEAESDFLSAIGFNTQSAASYYYLSKIKFSQKMYEESFNFAEKAFNIEPSNFWYKLQYAGLLFIKTDFTNAEKFYLQLIKEKPYTKFLYTDLFDLYVITGESNKIINLFDSYFQIFGYEQEMIREYVYLLYDNKMYDKANIFINNLNSINSDIVFYRVLLAEHFFVTDKISDADKLYKQLLQNNYSDSTLLLSYSYFTTQINDTSAYQSLVSKIVSSSQISFNTKLQIINNGLNTRFLDKEMQLSVFKNFYKTYPNRILPSQFLYNYYKNVNTDSAYFFLVHTVNNNSADFQLVKDVLYYEYTNNFNDSLFIHGKKYSEIFPNQPEVFLYLGISYYRKHDFSNAIFTLDYGKELIVEDNILNSHFSRYLALSYFANNQTDFAYDSFTRMYNLNPDYYEGIDDYAYFLAKQNFNMDFAVQLSEKCINYMPDEPKFNYTRAVIMFKKQEFLVSKILMQKIYETYKNSAQFLNDFGNILYMNSEFDLALSMWKASYESNRGEALKIKIDNFDTNKIEFFNKYLIKN